MSNIRKFENATVEQEISIINTNCFLLVLFVQSFIALQTAALRVANVKHFVLSSIFWLENNMIRKNWLTFAMLTQKLFLLFHSCSVKKEKLFNQLFLE